MKKITKIILFTIIILAIAMYYNIVYAATASATPSSKEVNVGDTVTVNVSITAGSWNFSINGGGLQAVGDASGLAGQTSITDNTTISKTYTFKAVKAGNYTISFSGDITDFKTDANTNITEIINPIQVTVKENEPTPTEPTDQTENPSEEPTTPTDPETPEENPNTPTQPETPEENPDTPTQPEQPDTPQQEEPKPTTPEITFTEVNKTMYVKSDCSYLNVREEASPSSKIISGINKNNSVTVLAIGSNGWFKVKTEKGVEGYVAGRDYLTYEKPSVTESSTATLSELTVNPGKLNEKFSKDTFSYTMTVEAEVDKVNVNAIPTDNKAKVTVTGNTGLTTGTGNEIKIKVLAEDEISSRTYTIKVTKLASEDEDPNIIEDLEEKKLGLSSLNIEGLKITPEFKTDVYEYKATLTDKSVEKLIVNAIASFEDSKVEITGADNIKDGENVVTVIVTSANGEETVTYQIIVNKEEPTVVAKVEPKQEENSNSKIILVVGAVIAISILITVFIIIKKKEKTKPVRIYEDGDYNETEDEYNSVSKVKNSNIEENTDEDEYQDDDDDDDDWGTPKRNIFGKIKRTGRHF